MPGFTAVTGVTGYVGSRVAARLTESGHPLRLVARQPEDIPPDLEGERVFGSYADQRAMTDACARASTLFLVSGREDKDRLEHHRRVVTAAAEAGVERIVYLSFLNASPDATFVLARQHHATEQFIRESGMDFVFLRDSFYVDFLPYFVGDDGAIRAPAGDGRVSFVARDDIADAAAAVLLSGEHSRTTFDITGPEAISLYEVAERLGAFIGRDIRYEPETEEEAYRSRSVYEAPDWEVEGWVTSYLAMANGELETVSDAVEGLAGHPPMSLERFLDAHPESYAHLVD